MSDILFIINSPKNIIFDRILNKFKKHILNIKILSHMNKISFIHERKFQIY